MDEILFRGKSKDTDEWIYGYLVKGFYWLGENNPMTVIFPDEVILYARCEVEKWEEVIPETVGQFINRYDKNNNKLFKGDIVNVYKKHSESPFTVAVIIDEHTLSERGVGRWHPQDTVIVEIVGNIYDNPELLKKGE